jgi:hypothetical protein
MGIQTSVITFKGKIGGLRGSTWKGKKTVAQQPSSYNDANTSVQQRNRRKFAVATSRGRLLLAAIALGFKKQAIGKTEMNVFTQLNLPFVTDNGSVATLPAEDVIVAKGNVPKFADISAAPGANPGEIVLTWTDNSDGNLALATDGGCRCDVCNQDDSVTFTNNSGTRSSESITIQKGAEHAGHEYTLYFFGKRAGNNDVTDSVAITVTAGS